MPDQRIFCNSPWYELQIYWDGGLGFCCAESHRIYPDAESNQYNVRNMTIAEWMDSEPMRRARLGMMGSKPNTFCSRCYREEQHAGSSRRHRCNQKSAIFTKQQFDRSIIQSPGWPKFQHSRDHDGAYDGQPIDLHIDLGNHCNLACKMCHPQASSRVAAQHVRWGIQDAKQYIGTDWTRDDAVWQRVLTELADISQLKNIHFMGGETLLTKRFQDFVDFMISRGRTDLCFSFVTNGTTFDQSLLDKLWRFQRVGVEVSIETATEHNGYQRQGTDTKAVLTNILRYLDQCDGIHQTVTVRPAVSLLTIGNFHSLLQFCLDHAVLVKSLVVVRPRYLDALILPQDIKDLYVDRYQKFIKDNDLAHEHCDQDYNESDRNQYRRVIRQQADMCLSILQQQRPHDSDDLLGETVAWCRRWDDVYDLDARVLYPEFRDFLDRHGY